ncbi:6867_t:CDS:10 [Ambispora gerdemannii]|uniref:6867_t:CDS:1 n=1 Tax=Ambispora gerdemannii TaxID=144530 RepID=A0A9N9DKN2_9GLOM|nr:6867_t:CDS:10 [Ambispora gerdemannii]
MSVNSLSNFCTLPSEKPHLFFNADPEARSEALKATKQLYELGGKISSIINSRQNVPSFDILLLDGFDNEQIWQQINMKNRPFFELFDQKYNELCNVITGSGQSANEKSVNLNEDSDDSDPDKLDADDSDLNANDITYYEFFNPPKRKSKSITKPTSKETKYNRDTDSEQDSPNFDKSDNVYFNNQGEKSSTKNLAAKLGDLFAPGKNEDEEEQTETKSSFQKQQEKMQKQIENLELGNIAEKDWTLVGEASSKDRPLNSLLEEDLEFDHAVKPIPVITEVVTEKLEDLIKQRILDGTFDDVERKTVFTMRPFLPSSLIELDHEKSKKSLAEIYEGEYVKQTNPDEYVNEKDEKLKLEHQEIENMFRTLCHKLDALSNFHYTPKMPKPEINVISNVPAITMEEVIPVNVNDASLLAPEEVFEKKKGEVKGETELDSAEKKRIRASKKRARKNANKKRENEAKQKMNPSSKKTNFNDNNKQKMLNVLMGQQNVSLIEKDGTKRSLKKNKKEASDVNISGSNLKL